MPLRLAFGSSRLDTSPSRACQTLDGGSRLCAMLEIFFGPWGRASQLHSTLGCGNEPAEGGTLPAVVDACAAIRGLIDAVVTG